MTVKNKHTALLKKLKKQVKLLQRRDEKNRNKLRIALIKMKKMGRIYKIKLAGKMRSMKGKISKAKSSAYTKVLEDIQRQLTKSITAKRKSLTSAMHKMDKISIAKLAKDFRKKAKKRKTLSRGKTVKKKTSKSKRRF